MKRLLLSLALLGSSYSANAQVIGDFSTSGAATLSSNTKLWGPARSTPFHSSRPLAENQKIEYYETSLPTLDWVAPADFGGLISISYGQRFTLPTDRGFVDSVRLNFTAAQGDVIAVALVKDTLFETSPGTFFHLIDIFSDADAYGQAAVPVSSIPQDGWVTVRFDHVEVPKDFFVVVLPNLQGSQFTSQFALRGDQKSTRVRTADNSRSAMVGVLTANGTTLSVILDSLITFEGQQGPAYTDFYIETYFNSDPSSVDRSTSMHAAVYPNPVVAGNVLRIDHQERISQVQVVNTLGMEVLNWNGLDSKVQLPTNQLVSGVYHLFITTDSGVITKKVVIQ